MRSSTRALVVAAAVLVLGSAAAGCGSHDGSAGHSGDGASPTTATAGRAIGVKMTDNAFQPSTFRVAKGETVTFTFTNDGAVTHEAVLGDEAAQMSHHQQMTGTTGMTGTTDHHDAMGGSDHHDAMDGAIGDSDHHRKSDSTAPAGHGHAGADMHDDDAVTVAPGRTGSLTHTFSESGTYLIGCHEPGHWEAGMKATVEVP